MTLENVKEARKVYADYCAARAADPEFDYEATVYASNYSVEVKIMLLNLMVNTYEAGIELTDAELIEMNENTLTDPESADYVAELAA